MTKNAKKKLSLGKETLRTLNELNLNLVGAAGSSFAGVCQQASVGASCGCQTTTY